MLKVCIVNSTTIDLKRNVLSINYVIARVLLGTWKKYIYLFFITRRVIKVICLLKLNESFDLCNYGKISTFISM